MAGKGDIDIGINVKDAGVAAAVDAIFNGAEGAVNDFNKLLGIEVQKKLVVETFFDPSTAQKGIRVVERDVNNLGAQIEKLAEKSKKLEFGSATSLKGQIREATQARDQIKRYEESIGVLGQKVLTVNQAWAVQNARVQELSRQLSIASANGFWAKAKAGLNLQGLSNFSNGLVAVTQGLQSASILIGQVTASFNQLFTALAKIQQFELSFKAIGASAGETSLAFQESERIAVGLGVGIQTVRDAFQQLSPVILASGGSISDVSAITESLSSRFAAFGLNADKARRVTNGIIQAFGKGKLQAEELTQQISEADPAFRIDLASAIGVSVAELGELVKTGQITSDRLIQLLPLLSKSSLLFGQLGDSGASAANALAKGAITITQARTQLENLNQLSFEQLARAFEPFLTAIIRVQAAFVDFGTAISNATALKVFGEFLGQLASQTGGVIDVIGKIALTFLSIIEAVGNVINAIDNFTQSIGGIRVVVTALAALITAKLVTALFELGATAIGAVVRAVASLITGVTTSGTSFGGLAAAAGKAVLSFTGLNAATVKQIASNAGLIASTGGVTAALQKTGTAATEAVGKIVGAGGTNAAPWLADIAKQANTGSQALGKLGPAVQQTIPAWISAGGAAKAYTKGTFDAFAASVQAAGGVSKVAGAAQAGLPAFIPFTTALQGAQAAAAGLGPAAVFAAGGTAAAGAAAGAATAPTLTLAGAVQATKVALAEAAISAGAFVLVLATNPIFLAVTAIALLVAGAIALNKTFGGSKASIDSFNEGLKGINKRTEEAKAAIDGAGDSATDFEERLDKLKTKADGFGAIDITIKAANAKKQFEEIETGVKKAFDTAKKAVESYDAAADKSGKEGLKRAKDIAAAEDTIALALQSTKQKRAELEQAATQGGKTVTAAEKVILAAYNENIRALENQRDELRKLKSEAKDKKIPVVIEAVNQTETVIKEIEGRIEQIGKPVSLNVDPETAKQAFFDVEALKISLERLKGNSYKIDVDIKFKADEAAIQNTLDLSKAIEANLRSAAAVADAATSVIKASLSAQEAGVQRQIDGLKKTEDIRQRSAQDEINHLNNIGATKETIQNAEAQNEAAKKAAQNQIEAGEQRLKQIAEQKRQAELKAAQARLDALPAIQEAERASLTAAQQLRDLALETLRIEQQQTLLALERLKAEVEAKKAKTKDPERSKALNDEANSLQKSIDNQKELLDLTEKRFETEKKIVNLERGTLSNKQKADTLEAEAKVIELEGVVKITTADVSSVEPAEVTVQTELQNDPELQKLVDDGKEADVKIVPLTEEAIKEIDDFFKEVQEGPDPKLLKPLVLNAVSPEIEEVEIISNIAPPDPRPVEEVVNDLSGEGVEIASVIKTPESDAITSEVEKIRDESAVITTQFEVPGSEAVLQKVQELGEEVLQIPSNVTEPVVTAVEDTIKSLEGDPIVIPVKVGPAEGGDSLTGPEVTTEAFDLGIARTDQPYTIEFRADAVEVERKLLELEERQRMIQLVVASEPGELEKINNEINKLEEQKRIIQIEYDNPDPMALQEWAKAGVNVPVKLETIEVENELRRLEERKRQIELGVAAEPGELQTVENQIRSLEARRTKIQVAYDSPNPEAINQLGRELEARNLQLKTSLQSPDPTPVNTQVADLAATPIVLRSTVAPLPTDTTKAQAAALATTPVQLKSSIARLPTEPIKAQVADLTANPVAFNPVIKPIDTTAAKAELAALADTDVNVPLTVNPDTTTAKEALGGIRAESDAISTSINSAKMATADLGLQAQAATSPFNLLGTATADLQTSSSAIQGNLAGIAPAATLASQPVNLLGTALAGASTDALATANSVDKIALGGRAASTAFGEFLLNAGGIDSAVGTATTSANTLKSAFLEAETALGLTRTTVDEISTGTREAGQNIQAAATNGEALGTALDGSATSSGQLSTGLSEVSTEAGTAATNVNVVNTNLQSSVATANNLTAALNAAAQAARNIRIPSGGNNYFAGGRVQGGAAVTVNEFGKEMFLSNSGKLSQINAPAWGTWRAPSSGTIIPAHIAAGINIPRGGVKVSSPGASFSTPSRKKGGSGLGKVVANLLSALNASQNARQNNSDSIQAAQALEIGKLSRAVDSLAKKDLNVNSDAIQAGQALEIGKLSRAVDKLAKKDWNVNVAVRGSSNTAYLDALNRSM